MKLNSQIWILDIEEWNETFLYRFNCILPQEQQNNSIMNKGKKVGRSKPKLLIEIEDFQKKIEQFKKEQRFNGVDVKPLRSAKNIHELKHFNFGEEAEQTCLTGRKLKKLKKLEEEKVNLIQSLEVLKESAVSAIAQKQDEITKLKMKTSFVDDQNIEVYEQKLYEQRQLRVSLQEERDELLKQLKYERQLHIMQLEEKENLIQKLCEEISEIRQEIQYLEQNDIANNKKIRLLQQENSHLSEQLEISSITTALKERSELVLDLDETIKDKPALSVASSIQSRRYFSYIQTTDHFFQSEIDKSYITEKLQEVQKAHKEQILELRSFYQKRIASLRQIYLRQLNLPTESSDADSVVRKRNGSSHSNTQSYKRSNSRKQIEGLQLNLRQRQNTRDMYCIEQIVENQLETSRSNLQNLKNQIRMQNLSQCPSVQQRFNTNQDAESQFTTKYFEIPNRFLKKNESSDSITITNDVELRMMKKKTYKEPQSSKNCSRKPSQVEIGLTPQPQPSNKSFIFGAGFLSGMALTSIAAFFFSKKSF